MLFTDELLSSYLSYSLDHPVGHVSFKVGEPKLFRILESSKLMIVITQITHVPFIRSTEKV